MLKIFIKKIDFNMRLWVVNREQSKKFKLQTKSPFKFLINIQFKLFEKV